MSSPAQLSTIISKIAVYDKKYARHFSSVVEPETDFFAGAGEKALAQAVAVWLRSTVVAK